MQNGFATLISMRLIYIIVFFAGAYAQAQELHPLMRRLAVFPIDTPAKYKSVADDTWWDVRKALTDNKRFLVASKNFLKQKDVYQSRGPLKPADAIILGQLLEANAVLTTYLRESEIHMDVYEAEYGRLLWKKSIRLQKSVPLSSQLQENSLKLVRDFISSIPYQGFVVKDPLQKSTVYFEDGRQFIKAQVGADAEVQVGDKIQVVNVRSVSLKPIFQEGSTIEVFAEGIVERVDRDSVTVHLKRATSVNDITPTSLVRIPKELGRLVKEFALKDDLRDKIDSAYFSPEMTELDQEIKENKPLVTSLSFLGNLGLFLLLAF